MKIEVSNGELLDKISILELKLLKIEDKEKLVNVQKEFEELNHGLLTWHGHHGMENVAGFSDTEVGSGIIHLNS